MRVSAGARRTLDEQALGRDDTGILMKVDGWVIRASQIVASRKMRTRLPLKARLRVPGGEVVLTVIEGEDVIAGLAPVDAENLGFVLRDAVREHLRSEEEGS